MTEREDFSSELRRQTELYKQGKKLVRLTTVGVKASASIGFVVELQAGIALALEKTKFGVISAAMGLSFFGAAYFFSRLRRIARKNTGINLSRIKQWTNPPDQN